MPVTPYTSSNTYTSRPYSRGNTGNLMTSTTTTSSYGAPKYYGGDTSPSKYYGGDTSPSKYYGGDTSSPKYYGGENSPSKYYGGDTLPSSITSTYKAGGYGKSKVPLPDDSLANKSPAYLAGRYKSSDYVTESQTLLELKLKKSNSNSTLFSGNTANILKNFGKADDKSRISPFLPPKPTYSEASRTEERKFCGKSGGLSVFANQYLAKVNRGKDYRPREIDTRDINTTVKPRVTPGFNLNNNGKGAAITRASRNVVRLTIKREELDDPFVVKDKTIKTIAHRLFEKYTDKEKKSDPYEYVPRRRLYEEKRRPDNGETSVSEAAAGADATSVSAVCTPSPSSIVTFSIASDATANSASKDPTISTTPLKKNSLADLRTTLSPQSSFDDEGGDVAYRLLRATSTAVKKKDLENAEEVKDAIIAVVLHPDVDIESDEEMKELVQGNKTEGSKWRAKKDIDKHTESSGDHSDEGKTIVGQLKRFVKKQVSTKGKKKSDEKEHRSSKKSKRESKKSENLIDELTSTQNTGKVDEIKTTASSSLSLSQKKKTSVKKDDSILSADLIFGANKLSKHKKSKDKVSKSADVESKESFHNGETSHSRESDKKSSLSLLSADLVYNNFTSDEENDSRTKTLAPTEKEKVETIQESITGLITKEEKQGEKEKKEVAITDHPNKSEIEEKTEKPISKIPKLKKKVKKMSAAPATEKATEVLPEIKVSPVGSPSETPPKGPGETEEKLTDFKEARESDTLSLINKKISSKTSTTAKAFETSDHQLESTSYVGHKKSIPGKEIKSVRSEKSSPDDKKEKLSEEKSISDVSVELKTSRNSKVGEIALGNKDENAVKLKVSREDEIALMDNRSGLVIAKDEVKEEREEEGKYGYLTNKDKELEGYKDNASSPSVSKIDSVKDTREDTTSILKKKISSKKSLSMSASKKKESKKAVIAIKENERAKEPESSTIDETFLSTEEKEVLKAAIEKDLGIMEGNTIQDRLDDKETKQEELPTDALTGKKAVKRPRQVGAPAPQENMLGNTDLMNMRKILKRPVKKIGITPAPEEKQEQDPTTPEDPNKKLWKRPISQLVPPKEGDQFLQARNVLKKPVKSKVPLEDKGDKPTGKLPELMLKKGKKPGAAPAQKEESGKEQRQSSRSPSSSDEEEGEGRDKMGERQKRLLKPRPPADKKAPSPPESPSGTAKLEGSGKDPKLSACQSADSGYGSSPSTPQPTQTAPDVKCEEICTVCGTNCHKKCEKQMANLCGVNQKLLAEALSSVKKAGSADGTSRTLASPAKSSSVSASESETTEDESETDTESDYKFFGLPEIRPPLQTRPKFKKYTIDDFLFVKVLGKGSYGKVMLAQQKDSENYFAVKCLKKDVVLEDNDVECTLIERKVLSLGTKHPYLCHLFCTFQTPSHLFFVMEYLTGGDLMFHIQHCGRFDEYRACFYGAEITSGLKFLHSKGIIYRDLKLDNILLDYQGHIRIADFGMCKLQVYLDRYADTFCGTPDYMAPEVIKGQHYNQCVDWWSFGVLLYEMLTGKSPFKGCDEDHLFWLICNDEPFFPKFLSLEATEILKGLLDKDSTRRLGIPFSPYGEIKDHAFFKYVDWNKIDRKEVETPYKPRLRHILDVQYFDRLFTKRLAAITPLDESILATMDQTAFTDFTYTNPNITD